MTDTDPALLAAAERLGNEWDVDVGFFWKLRQMEFDQAGFDRVLAVLSSLPGAELEITLPPVLVRYIWFMPLFANWQAEGVEMPTRAGMAKGADVAGFRNVASILESEVFRILACPEYRAALTWCTTHASPSSPAFASSQSAASSASSTSVG